MMSLFYWKRRSLWKGAAIIALILLPLAGCKKGPSNLSLAQPCTESNQCRSGICLFLTPASEDGLCTKPCTGGSECPEGWSCTAVTQEGIMVCQKGHSTPFGF